MADGHLRQQEFTEACQRLRRVLIMCARQVGKSWGIGQAMVRRSLNVPGSQSVFFGLNGVAVRDNFWRPVLKVLLARWQVPHTPWERMVVEFPNGSRILCTGTDDLTHVQNVLGNRFKGALLAVDEMQSQKQAIIRELLGSILPPTLTPESTIVLAGTIPPVPGGVWWELGKQPSWAQFGWGRVELAEPMPAELSPEEQLVHLERHLVSLNPHTPEAPQVLIDHLRDNRITVSDATVQRDWFGNKGAFDARERGYHYRSEVNGYGIDTPGRLHVTPGWLAELHAIMVNKLKIPPTAMAAVPWEGIDQFSVAIDPGAKDPCGIQCWGWGKKTSKIQQVFDWTSAWNARLNWSDIMTIGAFVQRHFRTHLWHYDTNSENELNTFDREYGVPAIRAADKRDKKGQIRKTNDKLKDGTIQVMLGSSLEADYLSAQLDPDKLAHDQWDWTDDYHPTASECGRYLLVPWWNQYKPPAPPAPKLDPFEAEAERMRRMAKQPRWKRQPTGF